MIHRRLNSGSRHRPASRNLARAALLALCIAGPGTASAQASQDSLLARLRRLEASLGTLEKQLAEQSESGVKAPDGSRVLFSWRVALNAFGNSRRVNNADDPQFVLVDPASGVGGRGGGMTMRHTRLMVSMNGGDAFGGSAAGSIDVDFYGGQTPSSGGRHFPLVRMRTARAVVAWQSAELLVGQESPLISSVNPQTPAAIGTPLFATAGNLWLWLPQVRFTAYNSAKKRFGIQGAVLAPTSGDPAAPHDTDYDLAERSSRPFVQGRVFVRFMEDLGRMSEIGCGVHQGWLVPVTEIETSSAFACDLMLMFSELSDIRGEFFTGQALRGLGGGGIGQNFFGAANDAVKTTGGFVQLNIAASEWLKLGAGCGVDHPTGAATRRRNDACAVSASVQPLGAFFVGAELRRLRTEYVSGRYTNDHVTLALGWGF